jgi:uncharacterized protein
MLRRKSSAAGPPAQAVEFLMKLSSQSSSGQNMVTAHGPGWIEIAGHRYQRSLRLTPDGIAAAWGPNPGEALSESHLASLAAFTGHVVLLGTGLRQRFPPPQLLRALVEAGLAPEIMDTGAACRTYNLLLAEGRAVVAALIIE